MQAQHLQFLKGSRWNGEIRALSDKEVPTGMHLGRDEPCSRLPHGCADKMRRSLGLRLSLELKSCLRVRRDGARPGMRSALSF